MWLKRINTYLAHYHYTDQQIDEAWCNMLGQFKESVIPLLQRLRLHYKLVLFSNTNQIHYEHAIQSMQKKFGHNILEKLFDSLHLSHKINVRKPDASAFQTVLRLENTQSYETVFIDDTKRHVQGAQTIGIKSYWLEKDKLVTDLFSE